MYYDYDVRLKISPPWVTCVHMLEALFDGDPNIAFNVDYQADCGPRVVLSTNDGEKAAALLKLLPSEFCYGGTRLFVDVDCSAPISNRAFPSNKELFEIAFKGNPAFAYAVCPSEEGYQWMGITYVVFKNCVVQFFNDNLNDCHGVVSTLYQNIAAEIFDIDGVCYNTDIEVGNLGKPLGEWP